MWFAHHVVGTRARALPLRADRGRKEQPRPCRVPLEDRPASGLEGPAATTTSRCPASAASPWASSASAPATRASSASATTSASAAPATSATSTN